MGVASLHETDIESTVDLLDDIVNIFYIIPRVVRIALLLGHCENMTMEHVTVMNTRGFDLVGINVIGTSQLRNVPHVPIRVVFLLLVCYMKFGHHMI